MILTWILLIALVAVVIAVVVIMTRRSAGDSAGEPVAVESGTRVRPTVKEFHVRSDIAEVYFDVPLSEPVDEVLAEILGREAAQVLREKRSSGLPLDGLKAIKAFGTGPNGPILASSTELETPGELPPETAYPDLVPHLGAGFDPLSHLGEMESSGPVGTDVASRPDAIGPAGEEIRLTARLDAGLRAQGIDTSTMSAGEMVLGLLALSGFAVTPGSSPGTHVASRAGKRTFVKVVDHARDDYPELEEAEVNRFILGFQSANADQGLLVTDKFAPYLIYDKERREPRIRFLSRERLQSFVDGLALS
ncbi:MAG: hypothetical protein HKN07_05525 [Acidimicrobiia bacterium]|nr:hypothetical protein [Acidimicrobiia bacterium]NNF63703.1 hypothetical protein [Acidimicrobiia bacterium]